MPHVPPLHQRFPLLGVQQELDKRVVADGARAVDIQLLPPSTNRTRTMSYGLRRVPLALGPLRKALLTRGKPSKTAHGSHPAL